MSRSKPFEYGEEFLLRVSWSRSPEHFVRRGEVMADMGLSPPDPPLTDEEMQQVAFVAKMEALRCLRRRGRRRSLKPAPGKETDR